jgi:hypothetical protein
MAMLSEEFIPILSRMPAHPAVAASAVIIMPAAISLIRPIWRLPLCGFTPLATTRTLPVHEQCTLRLALRAALC